MVEALFQDVRYAVRSLTRAPLLACVTVLTLAVGIGLNVGVFSVVNGLLFRARIDKDPESFAHLSPVYSGEFERGGKPWAVSFADYRAYQQAHSLRELAAWENVRVTIDKADAEPTLALVVTCNFFSVYGLNQPKLGRLFAADECSTPGKAPVVVLSEEIWRDRFGTDPAILGATIRLNRHSFTVTGIAPAGFSGRLRGPGIWIPYTMAAQFFDRQDLFAAAGPPWLTADGRLRPGVSRADAQAELRVIAKQQDALHPGRRTSMIVTNGSLVEEPSLRPKLIWIAPVILGALLLLLLIACTNVTMLLLSRAAARRSEIGIRLSLGAARQRLFAMLLTETLILAAIAGTISAVVAWFAPDIFLKVLASPSTPFYPMQPDLAVLAYLIGATLVAACIAGVSPAAESLKVDLSASLKGQAGLFGSGRGGGRRRGLMVAAQVAMSLVLLAGAGLFVRAQYTMLTANPGFDTEHVLVVQPRLEMPRYTKDSIESFYRLLTQRVDALPGVRLVSVGVPPLLGDETSDATEVRLPGQAKGTGKQAGVTVVSARFFETLSIPILRGRSFVELDAASSDKAPIAVVSEAFARTYWPGENPVGKLIELGDGDIPQVIGVARDTSADRFGTVDGPHVYRLRSSRRAALDPVLVRFVGDAGSVARSIKAVIAGMDREMIVTPRTLRSLIDDVVGRFGVLVKLVVILGSVAVLIAVIGIYGMVAFALSQRTKELAIRMALGATRGVILRSVLVSETRPVLYGLACGLVLAAAGAGALVQVLQATPVVLNARDPLTYVAVALVLAFSAVSAMLGPALRAASSDPLRALRQE
jgi:predicted permease